MMNDPVLGACGLRKRRGFPISLMIALLAIFLISLLIYHREFAYENTDFRVHALIAADFNFADLHTITSRLSYPLWHICVSVIYQLGMPIDWAASVVSAFCKGMTLILSYLLVNVSTQGKLKGWMLALASVGLMLVTALCLPWFNPNVYRGIGSPNVWHNPTQQAVTVAMLLCVPYLVHCWCEFERRLPTLGGRVMLPWGKVLLLSTLLMISLACKPTFMQALLPAAFVLFVIEWIRQPREWRYFVQIILAFLPAVAYFLLQYLYYTGVVVEYTSGVEIGITLTTVWQALRSTLMMSAFPLCALACCYKKGMFKDRMLVLALLLTVFSVLEAMTFRETGLRYGHGNFTWAANSSSFLLWVVMMGIFLRSFVQDVAAGTLCTIRKIGYGACCVLLVWHLASGIYYLNYLFTTYNAF